MTAASGALARGVVLACAAALCAGCASAPEATPRTASGAPAALLGAFVDDYGIAYEITDREWVQRPNAHYRIVRWAPEDRYLIAQNDAANPTDGGLWTRIDWVPLAGMAPYEWAFCLSVYDAPTPGAAAASGDADPSVPRTGCGGYPFSRMRRVAPGDSTGASRGY
ncbi:hypothetical protein [Rubricoccus marinus]|uniref:Secreted protein n=1 Tax=Rubricoccus marinus TaxID=716817 RepID=A0A259TV44_9BACT|nr:hypothetical protein [Rubricoccus marinus]OZC01570.1 hypothetical protein BSZ36_00355 [Rubricoccus marinus]